MTDRLLKMREVSAMTGLSANTIYRRIQAGDFPRQVQLGPRRVAWRQSEILDWITSRPEARAGE